MSKQSALAYYGLDMTLSPESSDVEDYDEEEEQQVFVEPMETTINPQELLEIAVAKRWTLFNAEGKDMRREVLQTRLIINLYKTIKNSGKIPMAAKKEEPVEPTPVYAQEFNEPTAKRFKSGY